MLTHDRLQFFLIICIALAMARVFMVMVYLTSDNSIPSQGPVGQLEHFAEMEHHRIVLRNLEEQRQALAAEQDDSSSNQQVDEEKKPQQDLKGAKSEDKESNSSKNEESMLRMQTIQEVISQKEGKWLHKEIKFPVSPTTGCLVENDDPFLLSLIISYPKNWKERQAIRDSYGKMEESDEKSIRTLFFVGSPPTEPLRSDMATKLKEENKQHGDIIQTSVNESVKKTNPPMARILAAFKWVITNCPMVKFVFIGNDELFINYHNLVKTLSSQTDKDIKGSYIGRSKRNARPQRDKNEWDYVPEGLFPGELYPQFCVGGAGYVVSREFIRRAYVKALENAKRAKKFPHADVYLGIICQQLQLWPKYNDNFRKAGGEANYCDLRDSVTMGEFNTPEKLLGAWGNFSTPLEKCPNAFPNQTDINEWSEGVNNVKYFDKVLKLDANPKNACERNKNTKAAPYLLALVSSQPEHFSLRDAIRKTWGAPRYMSPLNARTLFVLGRSKNQTEAMALRVHEEAKTKGDVILADFHESFHNLTLKVVLGLRWVSLHCNQIKFIYKGDDDMLVNFGRIIEHLENLPQKHADYYFLGHMMTRSPVVRTGSKYFVSRDNYPFKYFVPYFSGGGYIMSLAAARTMYKSSLYTKLIPIDDAFAGILAFRQNITLRGSNDFITTGSRKDACRLRTAFNLHGFKRTEIMIDTWNDFLNPQNTCDDK